MTMVFLDVLPDLLQTFEFIHDGLFFCSLARTGHCLDSLQLLQSKTLNKWAEKVGGMASKMSVYG